MTKPKFLYTTDDDSWFEARSKEEALNLISAEVSIVDDNVDFNVDFNECAILDVARDKLLQTFSLVVK